MKTRIIIGTLALCLPLSAMAGPTHYKCVSETGKVSYQTQPCGASQQEKVIKVNTDSKTIKQAGLREGEKRHLEYTRQKVLKEMELQTQKDVAKIQHDAKVKKAQIKADAEIEKAKIDANSQKVPSNVTQTKTQTDVIVVNQ